MTLTEKLTQQTHNETAMEVMHDRSVKAWQNIMDVLNRLDPITRAALTDLILQWHQDETDFDATIANVNRMRKRIERQEAYAAMPVAPTTPMQLRFETDAIDAKKTYVLPK